MADFLRCRREALAPSMAWVALVAARRLDRSEREHLYELASHHGSPLRARRSGKPQAFANPALNRKARATARSGAG